MRTLCTVISACALVAPAPAAAQYTAPLGTYVSQLQVAPDGAAWVTRDVTHAVRVAADGRARTMALPAPALASTIGADGRLWLGDGDGGLQRVDADGTVTSPREPGVADPEVGASLVAGPDGGLWSVVSGERTRLARFTPDGGYHETPLALPPCDEPYSWHALTRASDGAVWATDYRCARLLRITSDGAATAIPLPADVEPIGIAADASGGVWFSAGDPLGGHVTAAGVVTMLPANPAPDRLKPWSISVAPDGRPWLATQRCTLLRVAETGAVERHSAPIPATELAFAPTGGLWLASTTRVTRADAPGPCDQRPPKLTAALRRGVRITVDEPVSLALVISLLPRGDRRRERMGLDRVVTLRTGGTFRQRLPERWKLERGDRLSVFLQARDRDGNQASRTSTLQVPR